MKSSSTTAAGLADRLIQDFFAQERADRDAFWPERDVARIYHVTRHRARSAVDELVARGLLERRHGSGTFLRPAAFQSMARTCAKSPHPCVILPDWEIELATGFIAGFKRALDREALRRRWAVSYHHQRDIQHEPHFLERLIAGGANSVIFIDIHQESLPAAATLKQAGIPVLAIGSDLPVLKSLKIPVVSPNDRAAMQDLVLSLVSRGKRQIVLTGISAPVRSSDHLHGFAAAYQMLGLDYPVDMVVEGYDFEYIVRSLRRRFEGSPPPDAILFEESASFMTLIGLMPELSGAIRNGLTAAVFDELYLDEMFPDLPVISVRIPAETMGQKCAELIGLAVANQKVPQLTRLGSSILWPTRSPGCDPMHPPR